MQHRARPPRAVLVASLALPALLAACGDADMDAGPGGVSVGEARALDEAAEMLDSRRLPDEALAEEARTGEVGAGEADEADPGEPAADAAS